MNKTIETILDHRSIRDFKDQVIEEFVIEEIIKAAQAMPSSMNGQQVSVIVVQSKEKKAKIAEIAGGQFWIDKAPLFLLFVADFHKTDLAAKKNGLTQIIHESVEASMVGAVDVGLNMAAAMIAAESLGLGIVPIGGIRRDPQAMIELFQLPEKVYPVAGLAIGYPNDRSKKKPRLPMNTFRHDEVYSDEGFMESIQEYDELLAGFLMEAGREKEVNWSFNTSNAYQYVYFPKVYPTMEQQGFKNNK